jgi:alpha-N-arabinofuranosidase
MDGPWQVGHKTADEYGSWQPKPQRRYGLSTSLELVVRFSTRYETYPNGARRSRTYYESVDHISLHMYFANRAKTRQTISLSITSSILTL